MFLKYIKCDLEFDEIFLVSYISYLIVHIKTLMPKPRKPPTTEQPK